jgi:hypothetical protein
MPMAPGVQRKSLTGRRLPQVKNKPYRPLPDWQILVVDDRSKLLQNLRQKAKAAVGKLVVCLVRFCL